MSKLPPPPENGTSGPPADKKPQDYIPTKIWVGVCIAMFLIGLVVGITI